VDLKEETIIEKDKIEAEKEIKEIIIEAEISLVNQGKDLMMTEDTIIAIQTME
jgi:hypothetical protein